MRTVRQRLRGQKREHAGERQLGSGAIGHCRVLPSLRPQVSRTSRGVDANHRAFPADAAVSAIRTECAAKIFGALTAIITHTVINIPAVPATKVVLAQVGLEVSILQACVIDTSLSVSEHVDTKHSRYSNLSKEDAKDLAQEPIAQRCLV